MKIFASLVPRMSTDCLTMHSETVQVPGHCHLCRYTLETVTLSRFLPWRDGICLVRKRHEKVHSEFVRNRVL